MAIDPSISLNVKPVEPLSSLKDLLNVQNLSQQVKANKIALDIAGNTKAATIAQRQAESSQAQTGADVAARTADSVVQQNQNAANQGKYNLSKQQMDYSQQLAGGLIQDQRILSGDRNAQTEALADTENKMIEAGIPIGAVKARMAPLYTVSYHSPEKLQNVLKTIITQGQSPEGQAAYNTIPVSGQNQIGTDILGNMANVRTTPTGQKVVTPVNASGVTTSLAPGEREAIAPLTEFRNQTNSAAATAPDQHYNNQQIISILNNPDVLNQSGAGAGALAKVLGSVGLPVSKDYATNTNQLAHYIALQTQNSEKAMGVSTDAGRATASLATGSLEMTPKALINATKVNDATVSGLEHFNQGMEKAISSNGNNVLAARDFRNQWAQVYSPIAMQAYNAYKAGDQAELQDITKKLGGKDSPQFKEMIQKMQAMEKLSKTGSL